MEKFPWRSSYFCANGRIVHCTHDGRPAREVGGRTRGGSERGGRVVVGEVVELRWRAGGLCDAGGVGGSVWGKEVVEEKEGGQGCCHKGEYGRATGHVGGGGGGGLKGERVG